MKRVCFALIMLIVIAGVGLSVVAKDKSTPKLTCDEDGNFAILVVSDPQCDTETQWRQARDELEVLVERAQPDIVIINGDMNSYNKISADMWDLFITPLTKRNIYWSTTNGNHDPFKTEYYRMYKSYENCLNNTVSVFNDNYEASRPMNYALPIYSNNGQTIVFVIYGMDSGTSDGDGYEGLTKKQIEWYKQQSQNFKTQNGGQAVTSLLCMHIPLPQTLEMYYGGECNIYGVANEIKYNLKGYTCQKGKHIEKINVHTSSVERDNKMFDAILDAKDIKAVFFGHNHRNNFIGSYNGVLLGFVGKLSTGCYSDTACRGGRLVRFNQNAPQNFTTEWIGSLGLDNDQPKLFSNGTIQK